MKNPEVACLAIWFSGPRAVMTIVTADAAPQITRNDKNLNSRPTSRSGVFCLASALIIISVTAAMLKARTAANAAENQEGKG